MIATQGTPRACCVTLGPSQPTHIVYALTVKNARQLSIALPVLGIFVRQYRKSFCAQNSFFYASNLLSIIDGCFCHSFRRLQNKRLIAFAVGCLFVVLFLMFSISTRTQLLSVCVRVRVCVYSVRYSCRISPPP